MSSSALTTTAPTAPTTAPPVTAAAVPAPSTPSAPPDRSVVTRRVSFEEALAELPRHFAGDGDLIVSHLVGALSSVFPDGEDYFVRSVRRYRDRVEDPSLKRQVAGFIGQEAVHGREHRALNDRLHELGYPTKRFEALTRWALRTRERLLPASAQLAATAALEHVTATLGEMVLTSEDVRDRFGEPVIRDLFVWHAMEETEHKAVAFDVYRTIGGSERLRTFTMSMFRITFVAAMVAFVLISLAGDRATYRPGALRASWRRLKTSPLIDRDLWDKLGDYNRRGFHPDDIDSTELLDHWRDELFGEDGTLVDLMSTTAKG